MSPSAPISSARFRIESPTLAAEIREYMARHRGAVEAILQEGGEAAGREASARWSKVFDGLLSALFCAVRPTGKMEKIWDGLALAAVGSYGRGNFAYKSDLDLRILCRDPKKVAPVAEAFLYPLWDAGLQVGHQVITISETIALAKKDLSTATTLLDWRHLAGNAVESKKLRDKAFSTLFSPSMAPAFLDELAEQAVSRWQRFGDSVYILEPDVKNGQGGLRDLDICHWTAQARWQVAEVDGLVPLGVMLPAELSALNAAAGFLGRIRNILHLNSPRRTERLGFESQEVAAETMGYGGGGAGCEALMSDYYRHARVISNTREMLLARAAPLPKKRLKEKSLDGEVLQVGDQVALSESADLSARPELALRVYWQAVHNDMPVARLTRDRIMRAATNEEWCARLRASEEAARLFRRLIRQPRRVHFKQDSLLREFHDVGILLAMIPEFRPVVGRVHHDIYHVYTVDAHSIACVDKLRSFSSGKHSHEFPNASRIAADMARPHCLYMACLLHDIGKDEGGRAHSERGQEIVEPILRRLGVQEHDIVEIRHLILKHLRMYHVASRRDVDDPKTIEQFRDEVHGPEGLKELYLLTLCDVSTTSPSALTQWKRRMLEELYVNTLLSFEGLPKRSETRLDSIRNAARAQCTEPAESDFLEHFLHSVPDRYLYANEPQNIVLHARMCRQAEVQSQMVDMLAVDSPYAEVGVVVDDRPGALSAITAALSANRLRVVGAQLYSWVDRAGNKRVLDLFWVRSGNEPSKVKRALPRVEKDIESLLRGEVDADSLEESRRSLQLVARPSPDVETMITFDNRSASHHTVVEVLSKDRQGLLHSLSRTLAEAGLQVGLAKINTEGNAVADVFYVADSEGRKLTDESELAALEEKLKAAVIRAEQISPG